MREKDDYEVIIRLYYVVYTFVQNISYAYKFYLEYLHLYSQLGDLSVVLDDKVKELVCELSGKDEYEVNIIYLHVMSIICFANYSHKHTLQTTHITHYFI